MKVTKSPPKKREKRKHIRMDCLIPIEVVIGEVNLPSFEKLVVLLNSVNISGGGILVFSNISLKEDFIFNLNIDIDGNKIPAKGKVAWNNMSPITGLYEMGIEFVEIKDEDRIKILSLIEEKQKQDNPTKKQK